MRQGLLVGTFDRTYEQVRGPKPPEFAAYAERMKREFKELLATDPDEKSVQQFLERNPAMVPGSRTPGGTSGHWPLHLALIARPKLHGFNGYEPDFMWLSKHSGNWYPAMIEIERPGKRIFTANGIPGAEFNQARNQLKQWQVWLNEPTNQLNFMQHYGIDAWFNQCCQMRRHFILIYGRRSEFENHPQLSKARGNLLSGDEELMSFDRLAPEPHVQEAVTVQAIGNGKFKVLWVPEVFGLDPHVANFLPCYVGLEEAIEQNPNISPERCAFLKERIGYWLDWVKSKKGGVTGGDFME
jgi:hypothetical protein